MQDYGEVVCIVGSSASAYNCAIFMQADARYYLIYQINSHYKLVSLIVWQWSRCILKYANKCPSSLQLHRPIPFLVSPLPN